MMNKLAGKGTDGGFSLIELMVVIAIIGILATVSIPAYFNHMSRSRQSHAVNELMAIRASQEMYFAENEGQFATQIGLLPMYTSAGTVYDDGGYYQYEIIEKVPNSGNFDTIQALGDLNRDGNYTDKWQLAVDDLSGKPQSIGSGSEGFSWSSLGDMF